MRQPSNYLWSIIKRGQLAAGSGEWPTWRGKWPTGSFLVTFWALTKSCKPVCYCMSTFFLLESLLVQFSVFQVVRLFLRRTLTWCRVEHIDRSVFVEWLLFLCCFFACSDASVPTPDALLILEVRVILTWSSFNWQIERISLTTSLSSQSTLLYLTQWVELSCHLRGKLANSVSFSHSQVQMHLRKLFLSSSLGLPPSLVLFQVRKVLFSGPQTPT